MGNHLVKPADLSSHQILSTIEGLRTSGDFSDLVVTCGSDSHNVHKAIVCSQSDFFHKAVNFPGAKEAQDNRIDLVDDEPAVVKLLMQFFYQAEYDPVFPKSAPRSIEWHSCVRGSSRFALGCKMVLCAHHICGYNCDMSCRDFVCKPCTEMSKELVIRVPDGSADQIVVHAKMYEIADKYNVSLLKDFSMEKFRGACTKFWEDPKFAEAAHLVFSTTPDNDKGLRDIVSHTIAEYMELLKTPAIENLMTEYNGLAYGLLVAKGQQSGWF